MPKSHTSFFDSRHIFSRGMKLPNDAERLSQMQLFSCYPTWVMISRISPVYIGSVSLLGNVALRTVCPNTDDQTQKHPNESTTRTFKCPLGISQSTRDKHDWCKEYVGSSICKYRVWWKSSNRLSVFSPHGTKYAIVFHSTGQPNAWAACNSPNIM